MKSKLIILATSAAAALIPLPAIAQSWNMSCGQSLKDFVIDKKGEIILLNEVKIEIDKKGEIILLNEVKTKEDETKTFINFNNEGFAKCIEPNVHYNLVCKKIKYNRPSAGTLSIIDKNENEFELRYISGGSSYKCEMINKDTYKETLTVIDEFILDYGFNYPIVSKQAEVKFYKLLKPEF